MKKTSSIPRNRKTTNALQEIKHINFYSVYLKKIVEPYCHRKCLELSWLLAENSAKMEIHEYVITTIVKLSLKSLQELVRFETFNRSGIQQIQLDIQFSKSTLKDIAEDEAAVDFLLDKILSSAQVVYRMFENVIALHMYLNA
ncbi:Vacuolar protein sorting-associated protein 51-like protein [Forsythia ovata]|uniref:Vacuolar protein sorting-associated protein 51 homolog n=1 Tax=Forsythia ovata TaxID=205694 RepID=A0ABD1RLR4_9LAMI